ncbi:amino acid adenylation domain-containing protein [Nonomuraea sp. NPDC052116]|uniref:amino acid adenylation domain-containing protein n=1 Tax=Nonomuraea sp. NPDC052116 TaxID=3155665 RepID=UPI003449B6C3
MTRGDFPNVRTVAEVETLAWLLRWRAARRPEQVGHVFLAEDGAETPLTYGELDLRARAIAVRLRRAGLAEGDRALLLYPPGADFLAAFFGCLYAGVVAVPTFPPDPFRLDRTLPRLLATVTDADPRAALTVTPLLPLAGSLPGRMAWIATDAPASDAAEWRPPEATASSTAVLQYTSGSTAEPKGVILSHGNLLHNSRLIHEFFGTTADSRGMSWLPPYHDMGLIGGLLQPLYAGFPVWLMSPLDFLRRPLSWLETLSRVGVTVSGGPNFAYDLCVRKTTASERDRLDLSSWRVAFNGAEPVRRATLERFADAFAPAGFSKESFLPCYGLAEATLIVTGGFASSVDDSADDSVDDSADDRVGSGRSAPDQSVEIVDPGTCRPCPPGQVGEIWVRGPSVAGGYWGRPDLSREVFQARLASGSGYLRSGDLGFLRDGELVVTGRIKDLIIIRGRNHYPQDLEATAERAHPAVRPGGVAAFLVEDRLALVYELARDAGDVDIAAVSSSIRHRVAEEHGVNAGLVVAIPAGALPKTTSGKVRRDACRQRLLAGDLPEIGRSESDPDATDVSAAVTREELLAMPGDRRAGAVQDYLRARLAVLCAVPADDLTPDLPLLAAGLDSLGAQQLRQEVETELGLRLPLADILSGAALSEVATRIAASADGEAVPDPHTTAPAAPGTTTRLTPGQRTLWFLQQLAPESTAHTTVAAFRLSGPLDPLGLRAAFDALVSRHDALRAAFAGKDGEPVRVTLPNLPGAFEHVEVDGLDDEALRARLAEDAHRPFDLASGPLVRLRLYRRASDEHVVLVTAHHIVTDFWSTMILGRELAALYTERAGGPPAELAPPGADVMDVLAWQDALLSGPAGRELDRYWSRRIGEGAPPLELASWNAHNASDRGQARHFTIDSALIGRLKRCAAAEGVTLNVLLLAGFQALLHRLTGQDDIVVGTPVAARTGPGFAEIVGYLMNPVPIRSRADGRLTFRHLLKETRSQVIGAIEHQSLPSALLAERHARRGLFQTMFVFNQPNAADLARFPAVLLGHAGVRRAFGGGLVAESLPVEPRQSAFDVEVSLSEIDGEVRGLLRYRTSVFDGPGAERFAETFLTLLEAAAGDPETRLGTLLPATGAERVRVLREWNATDRAVDTSTTVAELFERQAARTPDATAVVAGGERVSYRELDERANQLAHLLGERGVTPGARVGIYLDKGPAMVEALLAVVKAGATYVPLDPLNPPERVATAFADASVTGVLSERALRDKLPEAPVILLDVDRPEIRRQPTTPPRVKPSDTAYVIYTSGSTGTPKGVAVPHAALTNHTLHAAEMYGISPADRILQFASIGFDASAEEIYPALAQGACLVLRTDRMLADPAGFLRACAAEAVTVLDLPTAFWHDLVGALEDGEAVLPETLRLVIIGGERALPDRVAAWLGRAGDRVRLVNTYGPTEATIVATSGELTGAAAPIGRPIANTRAYVLDEACRPVRAGVVGELYLGGIGLAHGYLDRPALTAERFVADPFGPAGGRLYRTGDLVRHLPDGSLAFVARADRQIKLNGYRVELGEIESALRRLPGVADAAVILREHLIAYVTPALPAEELRASLRAVLPGYMVPAHYVPLAALPRTVNGKIDYAGLPMADPVPVRERPAEPPRTPEERALAEIWREVLGVPEVGRHDDFFALGGHSLQATKVLARVADTLGLDLPLRAVFESPTLAALAARLPGAAPTRSGPVPPAPRDQPLPLSFVQERIWFLQQVEPDSTNYNVPRAMRLYGKVNLETVTRALADLEVRHEILRTTFPDFDGEPVQHVHEPRGIPVTTLDRTGLPEHERDAWIRDYILAAGQEPFDLAEGPLLRVSLVRLAAEEYVLVMVEHHMIHDGWAQGVFLRDFLELYEAHATGREPRLPELPVQYADFALWQRRAIAGERLTTLLDFWRGRLDGAPPLLRLTTDRPRPAESTLRGGEEVLVIEDGLARRLRELGRDHDATLFMTMFAVFAMLLYGDSRQQDIVVGSGIANRQRAELENLLGMMINTVLLRVDLSGDPAFPELLERVRDTCLEAYAHQDMPFEKLVQHLRPARSLSHTPLFQVMFSFLDTPMPRLRLPDVRLEVLNAHNRSAKFDLNAVIIPHAEDRFQDAGSGPREETITVLLEYSTDLFDAATVRGMLDRYLTLLRAVVARPGTSVAELVTGDGVLL